ncbi:MAG TPA: methyltransferase domain-containing protein [Jiangellaceae bacterium]|nr:methyltransferase domain-containing protein [Jiangellaceae bacterium]
MTIPPESSERVFARIDQSHLAPQLMSYLESVANLPEVRAWRAIALDLLAPGPGDRVLDAGSGLGEVAREIAALVGPGGEVTAVDLSQQMIDAARSRDDGVAAVRYEVADVTDLPFAANSFDRARCERVLQHLSDPDAAIGELVRVTVPDGVVCVLDTEWRSAAVDVDDPELVDAVFETMNVLSPQPAIGRTLRRRLARAGLIDVEVRIHPFTYTSLADAAQLYPQFNEQVPAEAGIVPADLRERWFAALRRADAEGTLWVSVLGYVAAGTVAEAAA